MTLPTLEANSLVDHVTTAWWAEVYNDMQATYQTVHPSFWYSVIKLIYA
jgi:hypothetical protein